MNRTLKAAGIKLYKYTFVQQLTEDDPDRRLEFCNWILSHPERWCRRIVYSDESMFFLNGQVNKHNLFYYLTKMSIVSRKRRLKSAGIIVWAAVSYDGDIVFDVSDHTMTKERYVTILQDIVSPFLSETQYCIISKTELHRITA